METILLSYTHRKDDFDTIFENRQFNFRKAGSAPDGGDGRRSAFKNLQDNCDAWDTVAAIDGDMDKLSNQ
jgi:hypothetical protein